MEEFVFNGKYYQFAEEINQPKEGVFEATLVDGNNVRCELLFRDGELIRIIELD